MYPPEEPPTTEFTEAGIAGWSDNSPTPLSQPTSPPNRSGNNQEIEATPRPPLTALEVLHDAEVSKAGEFEIDQDTSFMEVIRQRTTTTKGGVSAIKRQ